MAAPLLPRTSPESVGVSSSNVLAFVDGIEGAGLELHSLMLLRQGSVFAEGWWAPYKSEDVHLLYSLSKSFTSTAIGLAVAESLLSVDDFVTSFFPDDLPSEVSQNLRNMKVRHLLSMSTGHANDTLGNMVGRADGNWTRGFLEAPVEYEPGTHFFYNSGASYVLSAILQLLTGQTTLEYLRPRLLDPLGIEEATWETCPRGVSVGGWGMSITTDSIARFGQLYLQKGTWKDEQIISQDWVREATSFQVSNSVNGDGDWGQGYGYQFWRCHHDCYRGDGAFGQYCIVIPHADMVVAITASVSDMQAVMNLVWRHLLLPAKVDQLPEDAQGNQKLAERLQRLKLDVLEGEPFSPTAPLVSGRKYVNRGDDGLIQACRFDFGPDETTVTLWHKGNEHRIVGNFRKWREGTTTVEDKFQRIYANGVWKTENEFVLEGRYAESPSGISMTAHFDEDQIDMKVTLLFRLWTPDVPPFAGVVE